MSKWKQQVMFAQEFIDLQRELLNPAHESLVNEIAKLRADDFELKMSAIASDVGVILDGDYTEEDMRKLAPILTQKLVSKRTGIVFARAFPENPFPQ